MLAWPWRVASGWLTANMLIRAHDSVLGTHRCEGATADEAETIEHVKGRLARFKAPKTVTFGELPKTSTGKIQKFVLRDKAWAGAEHRIQ